MAVVKENSAEGGMVGSIVGAGVGLNYPPPVPQMLADLYQLAGWNRRGQSSQKSQPSLDDQQGEAAALVRNGLAGIQFIAQSEHDVLR